MPYKTTKDLPGAVRGALPDHAQRIFMHAFNSVYDGDDGKAAAAGWGAVKNAGYRKTDSGWAKSLARQPTAHPDGSLTRWGMSVAARYAAAWLSGLIDKGLEQAFPEMADVFLDIRNDGKTAQEYAGERFTVPG